MSCRYINTHDDQVGGGRDIMKNRVSRPRGGGYARYHSDRLHEQ